MKPAKKQRILIANGVNLDLLGRREAQHYGSFTLAEVETALRAEAPPHVTLTFFQTNDEAAMLAELAKSWDGIVLNAGAWTHTSLAIADRLRALGTPFVETHISNVAAREEFRHHSFLAPIASGVVFGFGMDSYRLALAGLVRKLGAAKG